MACRGPETPQRLNWAGRMLIVQNLISRQSRLTLDTPHHAAFADLGGDAVRADRTANLNPVVVTRSRRTGSRSPKLAMPWCADHGLAVATFSAARCPASM